MAQRLYGKRRLVPPTTQRNQVLRYSIDQIKWSVYRRNKTWYVKFNFPPRSGKYKAFTLLTENERIARGKAEAVVAAFLERQGLPPIPTLSAFSKLYLNDLVREVSHKHYTQRQRYCRSLEKYFGKKKRLADINSKSVLDEFMISTQKSRGKPLSNSSMNDWRTFLISYFNFGMKGYLDSNAAYELAVLTPNKRTNRYSIDQLQRLFQACLRVSKSARDSQVVMKHFYIVFGLLVRTGRRISEILNIKNKDIKVYSRPSRGLRMKSLLPELVIFLRDTKNKTDTQVFVSHDVAQYVLELKKRRAGEKYLFPFKPRKITDQLGREDERIPSDIIKPVWRQVTTLAKVKGGIHDIRRTFTVFATIMNVPRSVLMDIGGWKTEDMIEHYSSFERKEQYQYTMEMAKHMPLFGNPPPNFP